MSNRRTPSQKNGGWIAWTIILMLVLCAIVIGSVFVIRYSITNGVSTAKDSFLDTFENTRNDTYTQYHDKAFSKSEAEHHVSNDVTISIRAVKEKSSLEVLRVSDVVYIITDGTDNESDTTSWLKVSGTGVFTVNLTAAEYVVDNERQHVLVRVPKPVLDSSNISIDNFETLYFAENIWRSDNSVKSGEALARNQLSEAKQRIQEDFEVNEQYSKLAEASTESMLAALIKGINPEVENLQVEVEFYYIEGSAS